MRLLVTALLSVLTLVADSLPAEEFTSQAAKDAKTAYEADLKAAREKYKAALSKAVEAAVAEGDTDEVARLAVAIKQAGEPDPLEKARDVVAGRKFLFKRKGKPDHTMTFLANGKIKRVERGDSNDAWGIWIMVEERTLLYRNLSPEPGRRGNHFLLSFDEDYETARMMRLLPGEHSVEEIRLVGHAKADEDQSAEPTPDSTR